MADDEGVAYDEEWTTARGFLEGSRLRVGTTTESGTPIRLVVQLEYWYGGEWFVVARFDHDRNGPDYRNVRRVGLHLGVYRPEHDQIAKRTVSGPLPEKRAVGDAEE